MKNIRPLYCIIVVFLLGVLGGALGAHLYYKCRMDSHWGHGGENREERIVNRLDRELDLSAAQREQVKGIVHDTHEEIKGIRRQFRPQMDAAIEKSRVKIDAILSPEQKKKLEKMIAERKERSRDRDD